MSWLYLLVLGLVLWGGCGAVIGVGRKIWTTATVLRIHLAAAPILSFAVSVVHKLLAPSFDAGTRAMAITALIIVLDAGIVAPFFERSYAMFRSLIGTWIPFVLILAASWAAGSITFG